MRVSVIGCSGAGKTTFGRRLAARLRYPFVELDSIVHQAGWTRLADDEFRARVEAALAGPAWVCDGSYSAVDEVLRARATDVVWLDPPRAVVMAQVIWRSVSRGVTRQELWNGNREEIRAWLDPEHPIRWAWSRFDDVRRAHEARMRSREYAHLRFHRLPDRRARRAFLESIPDVLEGIADAASLPRRQAS